MRQPPRRPTPAEVQAAKGRTIRDVIRKDLDVLFCGINPGLYTAATGHHFARPGNRFWPALHDSGFTRRRLNPWEQQELSMSAAARRTWWRGPQRRPRSSTMTSCARAGGGSRAKFVAIVRASSRSWDSVRTVSRSVVRAQRSAVSTRRLRAPHCGCYRIPAA